MQFDYLGLQTLYNRYLLHVQKKRIEMPQSFLMRVAIGPASNELDREDRAIELYELPSAFYFMSSIPHAIQQWHAQVAALKLLPHHRAG